jgi:hypothetical protein
MKRQIPKGSRVPRPDDGNAFVPDTTGTHEGIRAPDAESDAEEFVASALTGEHIGEDSRDEVVDDEEGGPFIVLNDDGRLPTVPEERDPEREGHSSVEYEQRLRGGRWASRGA